MEKRITIVGCGPGSPEFVTPAAMAAYERADVVVGSERVLRLFPGEGPERIVVEKDIEVLLDRIAAVPPEKRVAVLVTGDPAVFSLGIAVVKRFGLKSCHIVPGVSSVQVALSRVGLGWLGARVLSAHHAKPVFEAHELRASDRIAVLAGSEKSFRWIADICEECGENYSFFVCEDLTLETESVREVSTEILRRGGFSGRTVVLLVRNDIRKDQGSWD